VARGQVLILTLELAATPGWQREFLADGPAIEEPRFTSPERIADALGSGAWDAEHGHLRSQREFYGARRLVVSEAA